MKHRSTKRIHICVPRLSYFARKRKSRRGTTTRVKIALESVIRVVLCWHHVKKIKAERLQYGWLKGTDTSCNQALS